MRKLQITGIYLTLLFILFFIPKPESLLEMETYESKLRKNEQIEQEEVIYLVNTAHKIDTSLYFQITP